MDLILISKLHVFESITIFFLILNQCIHAIDIDNDQDSINGRHQYKTLTRFIRETEKSCHIHDEPDNTKYRIIGNINHSGLYNSAENYNVVDIICDKGYSIQPHARNYSICRNGNFFPPLTKCLRSCPSLTSLTSTNVNCSWNTPNGVNMNLQDCINPIEGTTVSLSCNSFYEEPSITRNPIRVCINGQWNPPIAICYPICGIKRPRGKTNVINNGENVELGDYPWQVGVYNTKKELICGGSILDYRVILSAAHCFTDHDGNILSSNNYYIAAGKYYREYDDDKDKFVQYSKVRKVYVPARYRGINNLQGYDIAILILVDPFEISFRVQPVCMELFGESPDLQMSINKIGIVTGWGYTHPGRDLSEVLKEVEIPYIPYDECYSAVPNDFRTFITYDKFCGGYLNNDTSVCGGDSGGGLIFKKLNSDRYYIKGIVSASPITEDGVCDSNQYSVYTNVDLYINFVRTLLRYHEMRQNIECIENDCLNNNHVNKLPEECNSTAIYTCGLVGGLCKLPNFPINGKYILNQGDTYKPGGYVEQNSVLSIKCDNKFEYSESGVNESYCNRRGEWSPPLLRKCYDKPGYCYESGIYIKQGESSPAPLGDCGLIHCTHGIPMWGVSWQSCPFGTPKPGCFIRDWNNTQLYPDCCPHEVCS